MVTTVPPDGVLVPDKQEDIGTGNALTSLFVIILVLELTKNAENPFGVFTMNYWLKQAQIHWRYWLALFQVECLGVPSDQ